MIYLTVIGRCGNQMFQYAFAKRLAVIQKDSITINFGDLRPYVEKDAIPFRNELCNFIASSEYTTICTQEDLILKYGSVGQRTIYKLYWYLRKFYGRLGQDPHQVDKQLKFILSGFGIFIDTVEREKTFTVKKYRERNLFLRGYFENPSYFEPIKSIVSRDFIPLYPLLEQNVELFKKITSTNSVCVSFRKWAVGGREICGEDYYRSAFNYIVSHVDNPVFVIFSNDIAWVKEHFSLPKDCFFEEENNPIWEKVRLMSSCKHFILSNSTFAWWVQYLGQYEKKVVVSPRTWFEGDNKPDILIMKEFIVI